VNNSHFHLRSNLQQNLKGAENAHKTLYLPINDSEIKIKFEKLAPVFREMFGWDLDWSFEQLDTAIQKSASTFYPAMVSSGILTVDETRKELGYGPRKGDSDEGLDDESSRIRLVKTLEDIRKGL